MHVVIEKYIIANEDTAPANVAVIVSAVTFIVALYVSQEVVGTSGLNGVVNNRLQCFLEASTPVQPRMDLNRCYAMPWSCS